MTTLADFPARHSTRGRQSLLAAFDRRFDGRPFRRLVSSGVRPGIPHPGRLAGERPSPFEAAFPERR